MHEPVNIFLRPRSIKRIGHAIETTEELKTSSACNRNASPMRIIIIGITLWHGHPHGFCPSSIKKMFKDYVVSIALLIKKLHLLFDWNTDKERCSLILLRRKPNGAP